LLIIAVITNYYGSDASTSGIFHRYERDIKPNVKLLKETFDNGKDPKDVVLVEAVRDGKVRKTSGTYSIVLLSAYAYFPSVY
jgi:hypothetical protein